MTTPAASASQPVRDPAAVGLFRQLAPLMWPHRRLLALLTVGVVLAGSLEVVPPLLIRRIVDEHLTLGRGEGLLVLALLYLGATAGAQAITALYSYLAAVAAQGILHRLRVRLFAHLQRLPISYYDQTPLGDIISRCTADVETVDTLFSSGVSSLVADLFRVVIVAIAMVVLSPPLALASLLVTPPLALITRFFQVRVRDAERDNRRAVGVLNAHLQEDLGGVNVIRAFGREATFVARFRLALQRALAASNRATIYVAFYPPVTVILAGSATALLLWAGTRSIFPSWHISIGTLTAFVLLFQSFFKPIIALGEEWQTVQSALSGAERIFRVLVLPTEDTTDSREHRPHGQGGPAIELRDVVFGYLPERPVLRGVTLAVEPGEHVALVGRTGAGKSSTIHLLAGLYQPWSGTVRVSGVDPHTLGQEERRQVVGVVPQVVHLFSGTVLANLTLGDTSVPLEAAKRAAAIAGAAAFIQALPQGYDTPVSGSGRGTGAQLSAGQRQLLALTRALVWNPKVILLDEATASVDSASELAFRDALRNLVLTHGCAVLTVAHRLSTAREADRVIVMDGGQIIEEGTPAELARWGGRFAALLELETAGWDWRTLPSSG